MVTLQVDCGKGFYVRSLAHDVGQALGCGGHMKALARLRSGAFSVDDALSLDEAEERFADGSWREVLHSPDVALRGLRAIIVGTRVERDDAQRTSHRRGRGRRLQAGERALPCVLDGRALSGDCRVRCGAAAVEAGQGVCAGISGRKLTSMDRMGRIFCPSHIHPLTASVRVGSKLPPSRGKGLWGGGCVCGHQVRGRDMKALFDISFILAPPDPGIGYGFSFCPCPAQRLSECRLLWLESARNQWLGFSL